jgi:hypothetical protein
MIVGDLCRSVCQAHVRDRQPELTHVWRCALAAVMAHVLVVGSVVGAVAASGGSSRAISEDVRVSQVHSGWVAVVRNDGRDKLVPTIAVTLENVSNAALDGVHLTAVFRLVGETESWGDAYIPTITADGLAPHALTTPLVLQSRLGYTGTETWDQLLLNSQCVDVRVTVFAKRGAAQWQEIGEWLVQRDVVG